jgi:hypothetical protein
MSEPEINQELPHFAPFEHGLSESAEGVETNLAAAYPLQNGLQTVPVKSAGPEHVTSFRFKQETTLPVADVFPQHLGNERMKVYVAITSNFTLATALLPDVDHRTIGRYVLPCFESKQFCDSDSGRHEQNHSNPVNRPLATFDDVDDFLGRERWPVLLPLADLRQADVCQVPLPWIYLFEFFALCRSDDCLEDPEGLCDGLIGKAEKRRPLFFNSAFILATRSRASGLSSEARGLFPTTSFRYATAVE